MYLMKEILQLHDVAFLFEVLESPGDIIKSHNQPIHLHVWMEAQRVRRGECRTEEEKQRGGGVSGR